MGMLLPHVWSILFAVMGASKMELEIPIALILGFAAGYTVRAVISLRRRKAYRLRHARDLNAAEANDAHSNDFRHVQPPAR
jgi:hypothetical protein